MPTDSLATAPGPGPTFARLAAEVGPAIELVLDGRAQPITSVGLHDVADPIASVADLVVLVGRARRSATWADACAALEHAGAQALLIRTHNTDALVPRAADLGIGLGVVEPRVEWLLLLDLLRSAIAVHDDAAEHTTAIGSLYTLADQAAAMLGGAVAVEDSRGRILAYSTLGHPLDDARRESILSRTADVWKRKPAFRQTYEALQHGSAPIRMPPDPDLGRKRRLAIGLHAGGRFLGSLWVLEGEELMPDDAAQRIVEAAQHIALHLVRHRTYEDLDARRRGEAFRLLLEGRLSPSVAARQFGLPQEGRFVVVACQPQLPAADAAMAAQHIVRTLRLLMAAQRQTITTMLDAGIAQSLMQVPEGPDGPLAVQRFWAELVDRCDRELGVPITVAVGRIVEGLVQVPASALEADRILAAVGGGSGRSHTHDHIGARVVTLDDVRAAVVTHTIRERLADDPVWRLPALDRLVDADAQHGSQHVTTLRAWFHAGCDSAATAKLLGIHPNTLRHRLGRIRALGLDLDDPSIRFLAELHLRTE